MAGGDWTGDRTLLRLGKGEETELMLLERTCSFLSRFFRQPAYVRQVARQTGGELGEK